MLQLSALFRVSKSIIINSRLIILLYLYIKNDKQGGFSFQRTVCRKQAFYSLICKTSVLYTVSVSCVG